MATSSAEEIRGEVEIVHPGVRTAGEPSVIAARCPAASTRSRRMRAAMARAYLAGLREESCEDVRAPPPLAAVSCPRSMVTRDQPT